MRSAHARCAGAIEGAADAAIRKFRRDSMMQCGATCVPSDQGGVAFPMDFDLVLRDVRLPDAKPDQPTTDIGVKDGRIAAIARDARRQREGRGAGQRPAGLLGLRRDPHPSRQVLHPRPLRAHHQAQPAPRDGARVGGEAHLHGRGRDRARLGDHREMHQPRRHAHAPPLSRSIPRSACAVSRA